jgi:hypothetical protein
MDKTCKTTSPLVSKDSHLGCHLPQGSLAAHLQVLRKTSERGGYVSESRKDAGETKPKVAKASHMAQLKVYPPK